MFFLNGAMFLKLNCLNLQAILAKLTNNPLLWGTILPAFLKLIFFKFQHWILKYVKFLKVNCICHDNIICTHFLYKILVPKITMLCFGFEIFADKILYKKCACKMLMKLRACHGWWRILNTFLVLELRYFKGNLSNYF